MRKSFYDWALNYRDDFCYKNFIDFIIKLANKPTWLNPFPVNSCSYSEIQRYLIENGANTPQLNIFDSMFYQYLKITQEGQ